MQQQDQMVSFFSRNINVYKVNQSNRFNANKQELGQNCGKIGLKFKTVKSSVVM